MLRSKGSGGTGPTAGASQAAQLSATEQDRSYKSTTAPRPLLLCYFVALPSVVATAAVFFVSQHHQTPSTITAEL